jgi:ferredoxin-NADP reductase
MPWRVGRLVEVRDETPSARTLVLDVPDWPGHLAGQRVDLRLTAEDGYTARRSYSLAAPTNGSRVVLTVQRVVDGEVSPYLTQVFDVGDPVEIRGPIGGWFVWRPQDPGPLLLVAGGSGIVPLMAIVRARGAAASRVPCRLVYSARTPQDAFYSDELRRRARTDPGLDVTRVYTRASPPSRLTPPRRLGIAELSTAAWPAEFAATCYVCGPNGFVESVADMLVALGNDATRIRTERFGPGGR